MSPRSSNALSFVFTISLKEKCTAGTQQSSSDVDCMDCTYLVLPVIPQEVTVFVPTEKGPPKTDFPATLTAPELKDLDVL